MAQPMYEQDDFYSAALALAAEHGPANVTVAAITKLLNAPTGSFYHRFASRDVLLGNLWLRAVLDFQSGLSAALAEGDGLRAALHTPAWVRTHLDEGRLLLLYHRDDFVQGKWPRQLRAAVGEHTRRSREAVERFTLQRFGRAEPDDIRRVQFVLGEVPVAAVRQHLRRRQPPPPIVDDLIRTTYAAVLGRDRSPGRKRPPAD